MAIHSPTRAHSARLHTQPMAPFQFVISVMILFRFWLLTGLFPLTAATSVLSSPPVVATNTPSRSKSDTNTLTSFGFTGPEIFPIDAQISQLRVADLDGDGLNDVIIVNNSRSKINLLYNQTG